MFDKSIYKKRRKKLAEDVKNGVILIMGNNESPMNYPKNTYHFRQDSNFLYFFGLDHDGLAGLIDIDENKEYIFGNDVDMDDIIWMGFQPSMKDRIASVGVEHTLPFGELENYIKAAHAKGRKIHFTPPYRHDNMIWLNNVLEIPFKEMTGNSSELLITSIVKQRSVKSEHEVAEIEKAIDTAWLMHTTAMKMAMPGVWEQEIAGTIEGIAMAHGGPVSFPVILSMNGQTLHNHDHSQYLQEGRMMVVDAGCETSMHYASDMTRTVPVGLRFNSRQKEVYEAVLNANMKAIEVIKPGLLYRDIHKMAAAVLVDGLKGIGLMKGNTQDAVEAGAYALFLPHGLGHMMGLDVHDMENLGQIYVGYDDEIQPSTQFGISFLRLGRRLQPGFVITDEPGCYFIPALIDQWKAEGLHTDFINYKAVENYKDFGGIRIEDDILVTETGNLVLGKGVAKTVKDIEALR